MPNRDEERHLNRHSELRYCDALKLWFPRREWDKNGMKCKIHGHHGKPQNRGLSAEDEAKFKKIAEAFETPGQDVPAVPVAEAKPVNPLVEEQRKILQIFLDDAREQKVTTERWLAWQEKVLELSEDVSGKPLVSPRAIIDWWKQHLPELEKQIKSVEDELNKLVPGVE